MTEQEKKISIEDLNAGQKAAVDGFFEFLMDDKVSELHVTGPGGVGKTFTMSFFIDSVIPQYMEMCKLLGIKPKYDTAVMCATTNKAAAILSEATRRPTETVHSLFNLTVKNNFETGDVDLIQKKSWKIHNRKIIFIDEASMIDWNLLKFIREGTMGCKIIFISDHCQLPPVKEKISPIYTTDGKMYELTEPVRNAGQPALMNLCNQIRKTVLTGVFEPIQIIPGVIDLFDGDQMEEQIKQDFIEQTKQARILCYSNNQVHAYNDYVRNLRNLGSEFSVGEILVSNSATEVGNGEMLSIEEEVEVISVSPTTRLEIITPDAELEVRDMVLQSTYGTYNLPVPVDKDHYVNLVKYFQRVKDWVPFFYLKNNFPDLRPRDACTVHKAQGSTYDTAFIDASDISSCRNPNLAARLLYVAVSRARKRIIFFGDMSEKYGGFILP